MRLNPATVHKFESDAEEKIYKLLARCRFDEPVMAFHSLHLPEHEKKQMAEADFVIVSTYGVLVLEVKGGRLSCVDGVWYTTDRKGKTDRLKESPIEQAKTARFALEKMLERRLGFWRGKITFGFGVMFPDVNVGEIGVEYSKPMLFDALNLDRGDLARWIHRLYRFWRGRMPSTENLSPDEVQEICRALRSSFDKEISLLAEVDSAYQQMVSLTDQQYLVVDAVMSNPRVVVEGAAGTGKTLVAIRAAKGLASQDKKNKVLFVCRSPVLASFIRYRLRDTNINVLSFDALRHRVMRGEHFIFDALVVDEGQDMLDLNCLDVLEELFPAGLPEGKWCFFMDPNNQSSLYSDQDEDVLAYIRQNAFSMRLRRNCRNTFQIAKHTLFYTGCDIGECGIAGDSLPVLEKGNDYTSEEHLVALVNEQLAEWVDHHDVRLGDITLLSPFDFENSSARLLDKRWRRKITVINENFGERWQSTSLTFSTIRDFKGLENRYVMLLDLASLPSGDGALRELYVAMTRANAVLWMSVPEENRGWFNENGKSNSEALLQYLETNSNDK